MQHTRFFSLARYFVKATTHVDMYQHARVGQITLDRPAGI